ncbi:hypothetical protein D3C80_1857510 [compost metagenome]
MGVDAFTQMELPSFSDMATSMTPQGSIRSTASTASNSSIGSYNLDELFIEPTPPAPPASPTAEPTMFSFGSAKGYVKQPGTNHWGTTGRNSYRPVN